MSDQISSTENDHTKRSRSQKKLERANAGKVVRRFSRKAATLGFSQRKRSMWFARESGLTAQFVHVHKFSFGRYFRIHLGIRVLNDPDEVIALNGPHTTENLNFGFNDESIERCAQAMFDFLIEQAEPWFRGQTVDQLLQPNSCLYPEERDALRRAVNGDFSNEAERLSRMAMGL